MPRSQPAASIFDAKRAEHLRRWVVILGVFVIIANAAAAAYDQWRSYQTTVADTGRELDNVARILSEWGRAPSPDRLATRTRRRDRRLAALRAHKKVQPEA